jgi:hypothetical protein
MEGNGMSSPAEKITSKLHLQRDSLIKLGEEFCETGNQNLISADEWLRPVINDFIQMVQDRYTAIAKYAESNCTLAPDIVHAADEFYDEAVNALLRIYPLAVRHLVRGITSQIRNDLAINRLDTKAEIDEKIFNGAAADTILSSQDARWQDIVKEINAEPEKFKDFILTNSSARDAICDMVFKGNFFTLATQIANERIRDETAKVVRYTDSMNRSGQSYKTPLPENYFDAFRRYWLSLPLGNLYLAVAIQKMLQDQALLEHIIRYRVDVKELLLGHLPTAELRKQAIQIIFKDDYLDTRTISRLFEGLPEGQNVNWRADFAIYGVKKYLHHPHEDNGISHAEWEKSTYKIRAETYEKLLEQYKNAPSFVKKIIIYALLLSNGKKLQQLVYRYLGYSRADIAKKELRASLRQDAEQMKVDFERLDNEIIKEVVKTANTKKTFASGAYTGVLDKLKELNPISHEMF